MKSIAFILTSLTLAASNAAAWPSAVTVPRSEPSVVSRVPNSGNFTISAEGNFQAFFGSQCDGGAGSVIGFSRATCIKTQDRHSYRVNGCTASVLYWTGSGCTGSYVAVTANPGQCYNVNTGNNWQSTTVQCA